MALRPAVRRIVEAGGVASAAAGYRPGPTDLYLTAILKAGADHQLVADLRTFDGKGRSKTEADGEPDGFGFSLADRRDWRMGCHAGLSRRRRVGVPEGGGGA
jgi:hypothetical protein